MVNWKTCKFFKTLLGFKTTDSPPDKQLKRRWSLVKSSRRNSCPADLRNASKSIDETSIHHHHNERSLYKNEEATNKHAVALAAATAAAVEAAIAAAQAAAEVVRMTGRSIGYGVIEELAAVKIQSCFRAYLVCVAFFSCLK